MIPLARTIGRVLAVAGLILLTMIRPAPAALPDEIQVYTSDINAPGEFGLELHVNSTPSGHAQPSYPGEITTAHGWRITPEFSYGLSREWELGLYIPTVLSSDHTYYVTGQKLRIKWLPIQPDGDTGYFAGANLELSRIDRRFEQSTRALELRPIFGYRTPTWLVAVNPVLDWSLSGPERSGVPALRPGFKAGRSVASGVMAGLEYYADLGQANRLRGGPGQDQTLYLAIDVDRGPIVFNFGIGYGLTQAADRWTLKWIIEVPFR